jgi:hypothetical protein
MENRSFEQESISPPPESEADSNRTLELIEELGRDLDALGEPPPRHGVLKFFRRHLFRGAEN